ncbi:hypothetical protein CPC08DRAFT_717461 [Agrocybe pediades]|nr:hypothetical protein CPC08DRAFT_717461 [Agrocybe pediades]
MATSPKNTLLLILTLCLVVQASKEVPSAAVPASHLSTLGGLLSPGSITSRQEGVCPFAGGINCDAEFCCPADTVCQPNNVEEPLSCCPTTATNCNGGTACCPADSRCCTESFTGCCTSAARGKGADTRSVFTAMMMIVMAVVYVHVL